MQELPPEDDKTVKKSSFLEATTEALPQFTLSNIILRVYGVSDSLTTMVLQYFSLGSSILSLFSTFIMVSIVFCSSICKHDNSNILILQRQVYLSPMETPDLEISVKGFCSWFLWKIGVMVHLICTALPIALFISTLFIIGIVRESSPTMSVTMAIALHPAVTIPIGIFFHAVGEYVSAKLFKKTVKSTKFKIFKRLFTYSLNCHLAMIAGLTYYLFEIWIAFKDSTSVNFSNKPFNQCLCDDILPQYNVTCTNEETENSFQNKFSHVPSLPIILSLMIASIICHFIQALILVLPSPLSLVQFYLGQEVNKVKLPKKISISGSVIGIVLIVGLITVPYYTFDSYRANGKRR